jgi:hypothetical protein
MNRTNLSLAATMLALLSGTIPHNTAWEIK